LHSSCGTLDALLWSTSGHIRTRTQIALVRPGHRDLRSLDREGLVDLHELVKASGLMPRRGHVGFEEAVGQEGVYGNARGVRREVDGVAVAQLRAHGLRKANLVPWNSETRIAAVPARWCAPLLAAHLRGKTGSRHTAVEVRATAVALPHPRLLREWIVQL